MYYIYAVRCLLHIIFSVFLFNHFLIAQNPQYFIYNDENGLPSNEIYSIIQDNKGFVWFGSDAGLYKYDGIRYISYKCQKQKAKAITGLTISSSGKLYCYNFQSQVFMLQNDTLIEINNLFPLKITSISCQNNGELFISHSGGIDVFNEQKNSWKTYGTSDKELAISTNKYVAKLSKHQPNDTVLFLKTNSITKYANGKMFVTETNIFKNQSPGSFLLEFHNNQLWIFSAEKSEIYTYSKNKIEQIQNSNLLNLLSNRKITNVKSLPDGNLWICTYKGIIKYDANSKIAQLFYPEKSFSDCMFDREGNYWFSTLQTGLLRVPNISLLVWNTDNELLNNDKVSKISYGNDAIYFATINGTIGKLNHKTHELKTFHTGNHGDVQSFDYNANTKTLWFYMNNNLFSLKENTITHQDSELKAIKTMKLIENDCFTGTSHGLYINNKILKLRWIREIEYDQVNHTVWVASNDGLIKVVQKNNEWIIDRVLFEGEQILSVNFDDEHKLIYAITFNGKIYSINNQGKSNYVSEISDKIQVIKIKQHKEIIYVATNKGLWKYNIKNHTWEILTKLSGLASDNIQSLVVTDESVWLATGKGVQKIPLTTIQNNKTAKVYLKKIIAGNTIISNTQSVKLNYGESLLLYPEASAYNSNGNYQYMYRIKNSDTNWVKLPATIDVIDIQNIPFGDFEIEFKVIDHLGLDSENSILLSGTVTPPFWKNTWFTIFIIIATALLMYVLFKLRLLQIQKNQQQKIDKIQLENELRLSRETALKSQMNPHFIFNVLNSIKAYIYKNDKQKASAYLNEFSDLIRTFLNMSNVPLISLADELKMLKLYISMEKMLLKDEFEYQQHIDSEIDLSQTRIPTLIIQPFIENAFKHGLHYKNGEKRLIVNINNEDHYTICVEIIDNGIGRAAAQEIKQSEPINHESFATKAIEKRIELLNKNQPQIDVATVDLFDANNIAAGTKVILKIKIDA